MKIGPAVCNLTSLTPLQGKVSAVHTSSFFHLFSEEKQLELAHRVASLLLPQPGSIIFGSHVAMPNKGIRRKHARKWDMFCHSPKTWTSMWHEVFSVDGDGKGSERVRVETKLVSIDRKDHWQAVMGDGDMWHLLWSVTTV